MSKGETLKRVAFPILKSLQVDRLFRYLNREKVLILAYHGVTNKKYRIQPWILVSRVTLEQEIKFISERYRVITLNEAADAFKSGKDLPANTAVITFDDGYRNNYSIALPILQKYKVPATMFITAGYIGSKEILPMDEAYLIIVYSRNKKPITIKEIGLGPLYFNTDAALLESYHKTVAALKKHSTDKQKEYLCILRELLNSEYDQDIIKEDFELLSWEEIGVLLKSGLVHIGAHTVSHEILTNLELHEAFREIQDSKTIIQANTGVDINLFAYPNGTETDYNEDHITYLKNNAFKSAVTTTSKLNTISEDPFRLGRISVGPELSDNPTHFSLKVSGVLSALKALSKFSNKAFRIVF